MLKATLESLLGHKLRLVLTAIAVVLGVAFVSGTFVFTDTLNATFNRIFSSANSGVAVTVRGQPAIANFEGGAGTRKPVPAAVLTTIRKVDGVSAAEGVVQGQIVIFGRNGQPVTSNGPPTFGVNWVGNSQLSSFRLRSGRAPNGPDEVAVDRETAAREHFALGQDIAIVPAGGAVSHFTVVGVFAFNGGTLGGASFAAFDSAVAQRVLDMPTGYTSIGVAAQQGVTDATLRARIVKAIGGQYEVLTAADAARESKQAIETGLSFFNYFLLAFGAISLFVGSFIIINTFSILVVQRSREFSLLRALGATRRQVLVSVLTEALIVGLVASGVGVLCGIGLAKVLFWIFDKAGVSLPAQGLSVQPRTVAIGLGVGTLITLLASILPARRATRAAPIAALRASVPEAQPMTLTRILGGALLFVVGVALIGLGLFVSSDQRLFELGAGALIGFIGVAVLSPLVVRPVSTVLGWPAARLRGVPGVLARENARRSPRRTAATAAALMVGVAVVACFSSIASSLNASLEQQIGGVQKADFQVNQKSSSPLGFSPTVADKLRSDSRLRDVEQIRFGAFRLPSGEQPSLVALGTDSLAATVGFDTVSGNPYDLNTDTVLISDSAATGHGWRVGSQLSMKLADGAVIHPTVAAIYKANALLGDYTVALSAFAPHQQQARDLLLLVNGASGQSLEQTRSVLNEHLKSFPTLRAQDRQQYVNDQAAQLQTLLNVIYALLGLSVVIALLGIVNTLVLSVIERTRELGLLRALGLTRRQTRSMVRWEAVIIALLGALLGIVVGIALAAAIVRALHDQGITAFAVAGGQILAALVFAFIAGILAAIFPARRAARLRLLDALAAE